MAASKAQSLTVSHNEACAFEDAIVSWRKGGGKGRPWIAVESLFSMDGDVAPLAELSAIAGRHDAMLIVDEAHATGVCGREGCGLAAALEGRENVITVHTCGKALGAMGALVIAPKLYRTFLINRARAFIYATAPSPLVAAVVRQSLKICAASDERRAQLQKLVRIASDTLRQDFGLEATNMHIQPVIVGRDARAVALSQAMINAGFDVRAVRPPTVPEGTSRLRISLTLNVQEADVRAMLATLAKALQEHAE